MGKYIMKKTQSTAVILLSNNISVYFVQNIWYKNEEHFVAQLILMLAEWLITHRVSKQDEKEVEEIMVLPGVSL